MVCVWGVILNGHKVDKMIREFAEQISASWSSCLVIHKNSINGHCVQTLNRIIAHYP